MAIGWDETSPADTASIPAYPANERSHRAAAKAFAAVEHDEVDGRHAFGVGNSTARDAITTWVDGSIWGLLTGSAIKWQIYWTALGGWVDITPPSQYANRDATGSWTVPQYAIWETITPGGGSPNTITVSSATASFKKVTLVANSILSSPTLYTSTSGTTVVLEVIQDGTGGRTLSFGTVYYAAGGIAPSIGLAANARSILILTRLSDGFWLVSSIASIADIP